MDVGVVVDNCFDFDPTLAAAVVDVVVDVADADADAYDLMKACYCSNQYIDFDCTFAAAAAAAAAAVDCLLKEIEKEGHLVAAANHGIH